MFTVGTPKVGVSTTPLEELPATSAQARRADTYRTTPRLVKAAALSGRAAAHSSHRALMAWPPASALDLVMSQCSPSVRSMAASSACIWAMGSAPPAVSGWKVTNAKGCSPQAVRPKFSSSCARLRVGSVRRFSSPRPPSW